MDDIKFVGKIVVVVADVQQIFDAANHTGLISNAYKYGIVGTSINQIKSYSVFKYFNDIRRQDLMLLRSRDLNGQAADKALTNTISKIERAVQSLALLSCHNALSLLHNALAMPKRLRTKYRIELKPFSSGPLTRHTRTQTNIHFDNSNKRKLAFCLKMTSVLAQ